MCKGSPRRTTEEPFRGVHLTLFFLNGIRIEGPNACYEQLRGKVCIPHAVWVEIKKKKKKSNPCCTVYLRKISFKGVTKTTIAPPKKKKKTLENKSALPRGSRSPERIRRRKRMTSGRVLTEMSRQMCKDLPDSLAASEQMSGGTCRATGTREPDITPGYDAGLRQS